MINILNTVLYTYFVSDTKSPVEPLGVPTIFNDTGLQIVNVALRKHFSSCGTRVAEGITFSPVRQTVYKISFILFGEDFFFLVSATECRETVNMKIISAYLQGILV